MLLQKNLLDERRDRMNDLEVREEKHLSVRDGKEERGCEDCVRTDRIRNEALW